MPEEAACKLEGSAQFAGPIYPGGRSAQMFRFGSSSTAEKVVPGGEAVCLGGKEARPSLYRGDKRGVQLIDLLISTSLHTLPPSRCA